MMQIYLSKPAVYLSSTSAGLISDLSPDGSNTGSWFTLPKTGITPSPLYLKLNTLINNGSAVTLGYSSGGFTIYVNDAIISVVSEDHVRNKNFTIDWHFFCFVGLFFSFVFLFVFP